MGTAPHAPPISRSYPCHPPPSAGPAGCRCSIPTRARRTRTSPSRTGSGSRASRAVMTPHRPFAATRRSALAATCDGGRSITWDVIKSVAPGARASSSPAGAWRQVGDSCAATTTSRCDARCAARVAWSISSSLRNCSEAERLARCCCPRLARDAARTGRMEVREWLSPEGRAR